MMLKCVPRGLGRVVGCLLLALIWTGQAVGQGGIPALPSNIDPSLLPPELQRQLRDRAGDQAAPGAVLAPSEDRETATPSPPRIQPQVSLIEEEYSRRAGRSLRQIGYDVFGVGQPVSIRQVGAVQDSYLLGPGDELLIYLRGRVNQTFTVPVTREGTVVLPDLPPLPAAGLAFGEFRRNLRAEVEQRLLATEVHVSLAQVREISVALNGEINNPGVVRLNGLATVIDALHLAGGVKKTGSLRNVQIIRDGATIPIDLYDLILGRSSAAQMGIAQGDRIFVPVIGATVAAAGRIKRPGIFELPPGQDVVAAPELLELGGGVWIRGEYRYSVLRIRADGTEALVDLARLAGNTVRSGEILFAEPAIDVVVGQVDLRGHIKLPGTYALSAAPSVRALVTPDKLLADPYLPFAVVQSTDPRTYATRFEKIDLKAVLEGRSNRGLSSGDQVFVLGLEHVRFLTSAGVIDALDGSLGADATAEGRCGGLDFLARWVRANPRSDLASGQFATAVRDLAGGRQSCPPLFDQVPGLITFLLQNSVLVRGNVLNPGVYPIASPDGVDQVLAIARTVSGDARIDAFGEARQYAAALPRTTSRAAPARPSAARATSSQILELDQPRVELIGAVRYPGTKALDAAPTLADLIGTPEIYAENPYLLFGVILRRNPQTLLREVVPFSPAKVITGESNMRLQDRDIVRIFGFEDVRDLLREPTRDGPRPGERLDAEQEPTQEEASRRPAAAGVQAEALAAAVREGRISPADAATLAQRAGAGSPAEGMAAADRGGAEPAGPGAGLARAERRRGPERPDTATIVLPIDSLRRLFANNSVEMLGEVMVPGRYPVAGTVSLADLVSATGGLSGRADLSAVEITRYPVGRGGRKLEVDRSLIDLRMVRQGDIMLAAGNTVRINPLVSDREPGLVEIAGEVQRPGFYDIVRGEKLSSLLQRAGGLQPTAYPTGAVFTRESVRLAEASARQRAAREFHRALMGGVSEETGTRQQLNPQQVDLLTDLLDRLEATQAVGRLVVELNPLVLAQRPELDVTLEGGDRIVVPRRPLSVFVSGEVFNAGAQQFALNRTASDYIEAAGGLTEVADRSNIFVIRPDGSARRIAFSAWRSSAAEVPPGSWIVVPRDLSPFRLRDLTVSVTQILRDLALSAASIAVISRN